MIISIWWLIALSQFTLGTLIAAVFFAVALKLAKRQTADLKKIMNQTVADYQALASTIETLPAATSSPNSEFELSTEHTSCHENTLSLHNQALESIPDWSPAYAANPQNHEQLRTLIELYITHLLLNDEPSQAISSWHHFFEQHLYNLQSQQDIQRLQATSIDASKALWAEKKAHINSAFDELVLLCQKTDHTSEMHKLLNTLYNDFISVINTVPEIVEAQQDALLKMESVSHTQTSETNDISAIVAQLDVDVDVVQEDNTFKTEPPIQTESDSSIHQKDQNPIRHQNTEISPDNILPLSQQDIDDDDDLDAPQLAIQEFKEEEANTINLQPPSDVHMTQEPPHPEDAMASDQTTAIDDDMFNDLLSTMDDVIENQSQTSLTQNENNT